MRNFRGPLLFSWLGVITLPSLPITWSLLESILYLRGLFKQAIQSFFINLSEDFYLHRIRRLASRNQNCFYRVGNYMGEWECPVFYTLFISFFISDKLLRLWEGNFLCQGNINPAEARTFLRIPSAHIQLGFTFYLIVWLSEFSIF